MEWDTPPGPGPDAADDELVARSVHALDKFLSGRPEARAEISEVISRRLVGSPGTDDWTKLRNALADYAGADAGGLILWASVTDTRDEDRAARLRRMEEHGSKAGVALVRALRALHGVELQDAWDVFTELPDNWRLLDREIYMDVVRGRPMIRLQITKYNGDQMLLEGPGDSFLNMAGYLAVALSAVGDRSMFSESIIEYYLNNTATVFNMLMPDETPQPDGETPDAAGAPDTEPVRELTH
jgi:hypothetical protein